MIAATAYNYKTKQTIEVADVEVFLAGLMADQSGDKVQRTCYAVKNGHSVEFASASGVWLIRKVYAA